MYSKEKRKKRDQEKKERARQKEENIKKVTELAETYFPKGTKAKFVESQFYHADLKVIGEDDKTNTDRSTNKPQIDKNSYGNRQDDRFADRPLFE